MIRLAGGLFVLVLLVALQATTCTDSSDGQQPAQYLGEARKALESGDAKRAEALSIIAERDTAVRPWALLTKAMAVEKQGKFAAAIDAYRSIPKDSAASLDGRLGVLRLTLLGKGAPSEGGASVSALEQELRQAGRNELVDELLLLRGELAERSGDFDMASTLYLEVRRRGPSKDLAKRAREAITRAQQRLETQSPQASTASLIADAEQLLKESEPRLGLERVGAVKRLVKKDSPAYFEALLLEDQLLRAAGKPEDADNILEEVSTLGDDATAYDAMKRIIKNAWNKNQNERTLDYLKQLRARFGETRNADELRYIEARTLESTGGASRARELYRAVAESGQDLSFRVKSIRQLGWTAIYDKEHREAAKWFRLGTEITKKALDEASTSVKNGYGTDDLAASRSRVKAVRDLLDDYLHFVYWLGFAVENGGAESKTAAGGVTAPELYRKVIDTAPRSYYGSLAAVSSGLAIQALPPVPSGTCEMSVPASTSAVLGSLSTAGLRDWSQAEADWFLGRQLSHAEKEKVEAAIAGARQIDREDLSVILTKAALSLRFGRPDKGVILADSIFKRPSLVNPFSFDSGDCFAALEQLAFPAPYLELFQRAANQHQIPLALALAQSRTESFFNPDARSLKDARGLLQLLESTARSEGMPEDGDLFQPEVNIQLGVKHIATLLKRFDNRPAYAAAAYNAGSDATKRWIERRAPLNTAAWVESISYPETRDYVKKVLLAKAVYERMIPVPKS